MPLYTVYTLDGRSFFTKDDPKQWHYNKEDTWDRWWVSFTDTKGETVQLNPDLIVSIIWTKKEGHDDRN